MKRTKDTVVAAPNTTTKPLDVCSLLFHHRVDVLIAFKTPPGAEKVEVVHERPSSCPPSQSRLALASTSSHSQVGLSLTCMVTSAYALKALKTSNMASRTGSKSDPVPISDDVFSMPAPTRSTLQVAYLWLLHRPERYYLFDRLR